LSDKYNIDFHKLNFHPERVSKWIKLDFERVMKNLAVHDNLV